jgi:hypothetical protein
MNETRGTILANFKYSDFMGDGDVPIGRNDIEEFDGNGDLHKNVPMK